MVDIEIARRLTKRAQDIQPPSKPLRGYPPTSEAIVAQSHKPALAKYRMPLPPFIAVSYVKCERVGAAIDYPQAKGGISVHAP